MVTFLRSKADQVFSIESNLIVMYQIRVFAFIHATSRKIDDTFFFINVLDFSNIKFSFCYLTYRFTFLSIVQIDMVTAIAFAGPNNMFSVCEVETSLMVIIDILLVLFLNQCTHLSCLYREFQYTISLVTALIKLKCHMFTIGFPTGGSYVILLMK